jgi:hypothetical protein
MHKSRKFLSSRRWEVYFLALGAADLLKSLALTNDQATWREVDRN